MKYKNIQIGDIMTAYGKGYWQLDKIERRFHPLNEQKWILEAYNQKPGDEFSPIYHYHLVADSNFKPVKGKAKTACCDATYCRKITLQRITEIRQQLLKELEEKNKGLNYLQGFLNDKN